MNRFVQKSELMIKTKEMIEEGEGMSEGGCRDGVGVRGCGIGRWRERQEGGLVRGGWWVEKEMTQSDVQVESES